MSMCLAGARPGGETRRPAEHGGIGARNRIGGSKVKVAVTSRGEDLEADVDPRFGRARYVIVYETDDDTFSVIDNLKAMNAEQGAGIQAAEAVSRAGAVALLTGNCGPKAFGVLQSAGVSVYVGVSGKVKDAIQALKVGELTPADSPNVEGHWS